MDWVSVYTRFQCTAIAPTGRSGPCNPVECPFYADVEYTDLFVCACHGTIHFCTDGDSCKKKRLTNTGWVCPISAICYPTNTEETLGAVAAFAAHRAVATTRTRKKTGTKRTCFVANIRGERPTASQKKQKVLVPELDNQLVLRTLVPLLAEDNQYRKQWFVHHRKRVRDFACKYVNALRRRREPIPLATLLDMALGCMPSLLGVGGLPDAACHHYASICTEWYMRIQKHRSRASSNASKRYKLKYHVPAMLYTLRTGLKDTNDVKLNADPLLLALLPPIQDLALDMFGYTPRHITRHKEWFRQAFLLDRELDPQYPPPKPWKGSQRFLAEAKW